MLKALMSKQRKPWIAAAANLFLPPLGHIYVGHAWRGVVLYALWRIPFVFLIVGLLWFPNPVFMRLVFVALVLALPAMALDAWLISRHQEADHNLKPYNRWYWYVGVALTLILLGEVIRFTIVKAYKVPSEAMMPTLLLGDHFIINKLMFHFRDPARGDLIVFEFPEDPTKHFVERIIALPGETVEVKGEKVLINGLPLSEPYAIFTGPRPGVHAPALREYGPRQVPPGYYFVLGDNRDRSYDSRFWGPIAASKIFGTASVIYLSWEPWRIRWDRIGRPLSEGVSPTHQ